MTWSTSTPAGSDSLANGDNIIRELKTDIQTALRGDDTEGVEAVFPGSDTANPVYRYRGLKGTTAARPTAGQYGLYVNTTLNTIQRDSGSAWEDVATLIPSGTKMVFYQASAPTGWTAVAVNDKFLRVVTAGGTGGTTGGTMAASTSLAHTHTVASHTHTTPAHSHLFEYDTLTTGNVVYSVPTYTDSEFGLRDVFTGSGAHTYSDYRSHQTDDGRLKTITGGSGSLVTESYRSYGYPYTKTSGAGTTGGTSLTTDDALASAFAYADVVVASKD